MIVTKVRLRLTHHLVASVGYGCSVSLGRKMSLFWSSLFSIASQLATTLPQRRLDMIMCALWGILFCARYGMLKLLLTPKGYDSNFRFCQLLCKWIFYVYKEGSHLDHASCGIFSENSLSLLMAWKYGHSGARGLNRLRIRCKILGQASILLLIDIDSLQQLNKNSAEPAYVTSHVIVSNLHCLSLLWVTTDQRVKAWTDKLVAKLWCWLREMHI